MKFDEIRMVLNSLRHDCERARKVRTAIKIVSDKTGIPKARVRQMIIHIFKDKEELNEKERIQEIS